MTGLYRITYLVIQTGISNPTPADALKISEMFEVDSAEAAIAQVKTKHPTDLIKITSVAQLR